MKIAKFGGSSVGSFERMLKCSQILSQDSTIQVAVLSASGKTTDNLIKISSMCASGNPMAWETFQTLKEHHQAFLHQFDHNVTELTQFLQTKFDELTNIFRGIELLRECSTQTLDKLVSYGEILSTRIFCEVLKQQGLNAVWFDVRDVMITRGDFGAAKPKLAKLKELVGQQLTSKFSEKVTEGQIVVTQGFIGKNCQNQTTTLGRGGSDYSAALLAEAISTDSIQVEELQIWTDVSGMFSADPRIVSDAGVISEISFDESSELSVFGAKVLHPATLEPARRAGIPVFVGNSQDPASGGTQIIEATSTRPTFRAVASRGNQCLLTLSSPKMLQTAGFLGQIFSILGEHKISVDLISTSQIKVALTLDNPQAFSEEVHDQLSEICQVEFRTGYGLVSIIGNDLDERSGLVAKILGSLEKFKIQFISFGAGEHNLSFLVPERDEADIIQELHQHFLSANCNFETPETSVSSSALESQEVRA